MALFEEAADPRQGHTACAAPHELMPKLIQLTLSLRKGRHEDWEEESSAGRRLADSVNGDSDKWKKRVTLLSE